MMRKYIIGTALTMLSTFYVAAQKTNVLEVASTIGDSAIIFPESFEADTQKMLEGWYIKNYTATDDRYATMPDKETSDATITSRLAAMPTVVEMPFNSVVRSCIDRYTKKGRKQVAVLLGLSHYYMPIFEQALEEQGLPLELKYLPVIESGLNPNAVSRSGAAGLWQFKLGTAKGLGMEVNSLVDERRDPYVSSQKAASYLKDLYAMYGDWSLAIAAYNCGPGNVNKAIRRAGGDPKSHNFWTIYNYLSPEAQGYFPTFIAANYVMNYYTEHNISPVLAKKPLVTDTVGVCKRVNLNQISAVMQIPMDELRVLNPQFRADEIPGTPEKPYFLVLPSQQIHAYIMSEDRIIDYEREKYERAEVVEIGALPTAEPGTETAAAEPLADEAADEAEVAVVHANAQAVRGETTTIMHKVAAGETLASIADRYGVEPAQVKEWNALRRNAVRTGQQLKIRVAKEVNQELASQQPAVVKQETPKASNQSSASSKKQQTAKTQQRKKESKPTSHTIKKGETLSSIAAKHGVTVAALKKENNLRNDNIRAGKTLKIPAKSKQRKRR